MALPPVKFSIIAIGAEEAKAALRTVGSAISDFERQRVRLKHEADDQISRLEAEFKQDQQRSILEQTRLEMEGAKKITRTLEQEWKDVEGKFRSHADAKLKIEQDYLRRLKTLQQREADSAAKEQARTAASQAAARARLAQGGTLAGSIGLTGEGGGLGLFMLAEEGQKLDPGLNFMKAAKWAAGFVYDQIVAAFKFGASQIAGSILELGGAQSIQQSIVGAGHAQTMAAINWAMSVNRGGITPAGNLHDIRAMSFGTQFNMQEVAEAQSEWVKRTGDLTGFNRQFEMFNKMATVSGLTLAQVSQSMAILRQQFQDLDENQFRKLELAAFGLSKFGEVPFQEIMKLSKATGAEALFTGGGDRQVANFAFLSAIVQKTAASMGGGGQAATALSRFYGHMVSRGGFGFGPGLVKDPQGELVAAAVAFHNDPTIFKGRGYGLPEQRLIELLSARITGGTKEEETKQLNTWIDTIKRQVETQQQLDDEYKEVSQTVEVILKKAFVTLANVIGSMGLGAIGEANIGAKIELFAGALQDNAEQIKTVFGDIIETSIDLAKLFYILAVDTVELIKMFAGVASALSLIVDPTGGTAAKISGSTTSLIDQSEKTLDSMRKLAKDFDILQSGVREKMENPEVYHMGTLRVIPPEEAVAKKVELSDKSVKDLGREIHNNFNIHNPFKRHWEPIGSGRTGS